MILQNPRYVKNSQKGVKKAKKVSKGLKYRKTPGKYPENTPALIIRKLVKSCALRSQKGVKKGSKRGQNSQKGVKTGLKQGYPRTLKKGSKTAKNSQKQPKRGLKTVSALTLISTSRLVLPQTHENHARKSRALLLTPTFTSD